MTQSQQALRRNPAVGNNTQYGRHEQRNDTLHGIKYSDMASQTNFSQIGTHRRKISSPHSKLQEVHNDQSNLDIHSFHILVAHKGFPHPPSKIKQI